MPEREIPAAARAVRHRVVLLALQESRLGLRRRLDCKAGRMRPDRQRRQCGRQGDQGWHAAAPRAGASDRQRLPGGRQVQQRPRQRKLPQLPRPPGAVDGSAHRLLLRRVRRGDQRGHQCGSFADLGNN